MGGEVVVLWGGAECVGVVQWGVRLYERVPCVHDMI